ncbi:S28A2 protein, partial [Columbina picui]|nr:S28A2 protein [Columbina picui]
WDFLFRLLWVALLGGLIAWLALDTSKNPEQLISLAGFCFFVLLLFACSKHHRAVRVSGVAWPRSPRRRWPPRTGNKCLLLAGPSLKLAGGSRSQAGLLGTAWGAQLVGEHFCGTGKALGRRRSLSPCSCACPGGRVFFSLPRRPVSLHGRASRTAGFSLSQTEAPLLIRPYLADMTHSEVHAVMTGGFSTIAGSVMGAYISFGIDAASLIAASVMAAPCALAMSKLIYPEVEESKFKGKASVYLASGEERNILDAASNGAATSVGLVANIAANLIAFLAVLEFINAALRWFGGMVDIEGLSFQVICSYVLMPVAFLMGADWADSPLVAELLGIKIFLNEFVAYQQLATYKKNRLSGLEEWDGSRKQWISQGSDSPWSLLRPAASLAPERKGDFASIVLRALFTGICVSMLNACLAGLLHVPTEVGNCVTFLSTTNFSSTSYTTYTCCQQLFASSLLINGTLSFSGAWAGLAQSELCLAQCCGRYNHSSCTG